MSQLPDNLVQGTADWRGIIRSNNHKTFFVIAVFILIYVALGVLVDMYMASQHYPQATPGELFQGLITLKIFPLATLIMLGVAGISLLVTFSFHDRLMLLGTEYREITAETAKDTTEQQLYNVVEEMKLLPACISCQKFI